MNAHRLSLASVVAFASMLAGFPAEARTFIDQAGRTLEGEVLKVEGTMVTIKRASDGQVFTVPATTFSKADQAFFVGKGGGGAPPPSTPSASSNEAASTAKEQSIFSVDLISPSREHLWVDENWREGAECIQAKLSTTSDVSGKGVSMRAYFFSADGTLVETIKRPSDQASYQGDGSIVKAIAEFQKGRKYQVFFGIPEAIKSGAKKWKRAIVVFGQKGDFDAKIYPKDDMKKFDFPEKASIPAARLSQ